MTCHFATVVGSERAAHDPDNPIEFDPELNEYNLKTPHGHSLRIYHCPFCAGRAPDSLRGQMFADVSSEEAIRLHKLIKDIKTEGDVISALGEATYVVDPGTTCADPDKDGKPGKIHTFKTLRYEALSDDGPGSSKRISTGMGKLSSFYGKYIGKPPNDLTKRWS